MSSIISNLLLKRLCLPAPFSYHYQPLLFPPACLQQTLHTRQLDQATAEYLENALLNLSK